MTTHEAIPLARPDLGEREEEMVLDVVRSGRLSLGPALERFEREFARWLGVEDAVAVSSGTAGLHLGVRALGWGSGDEVVTSPLSFVASANCLLYEGAVPVFCDVDPVTLNIDPAPAQAAMGSRTAGLLPVHVFGYPAAMPELEALAARSGLGILEDACEAAGAVDAGGVAVGARGNLAVFGFYANKQLTTGEGGMAIPPASETAGLLRSERNQGRGRSGWPLPPMRRTRSRAPELVRLRRSAARRCRPGRGDRGARRGGNRRQGLPALHPSHAPLPGAVRPARGPVSGCRARRGALAGASLLHRDERGTGRPRGGRSG